MENRNIQLSEETNAKYKTEILNCFNMTLKYQKLSKKMLYIGLSIIIISLILSPFLPYVNKENQKIEFQEYDQSLTVNSESYVDIVEAIPVGTLVETKTYGVAELSSVNIGYFLFLDTNGNNGILEVTGDYDINSFTSKLEDNSAPIRIYGIIADNPNSISIDYDALIQAATEENLDPENSVQIFDDAYEEKENFEEIISKYKILNCDFSMPMTKEVTSLGIGIIFLVLAGFFFALMLIFKYRASSCEANTKYIEAKYSQHS